MGYKQIIRGVLASALAAMISGTALAAEKPVVVRTDTGPVEGLSKSGQTTFLGIPFAAPPVGPLRWKAPQPVTPWTAPRKAQAFGEGCAQIDTLGKFAKPSVQEDCLYLNVFTPAKPSRTKRPVMFWIHGGGLRAGSAADYDASALVARGTVVVSINYRLGLFGYYANPGLGADNVSANYGLLDQIAGLEWVRRNIAKFGGDPGNVTIFGESAGARSVAVLLSSPPAKGLFHRAIMQSVGYDGTTIALGDAQAKGRQVAVAAGCGAEDAACLRKLSVEQILKIQGLSSVTPVRGGPDLPESLQTVLENGNFNRVPVIAGWTRDETTWQMALAELARGRPTVEADIRANAIQRGGPDPERQAKILQLYSSATRGSPGLAAAGIFTDSGLVCPTRRMMAVLSRFVPVYAFEFADEDAPQYNPPVSFAYGAAHTSELQYLFPGYRGATGERQPLSHAQQKLAGQMQAMWTDFARTGNPTPRSGSARWQRYDPAQDNLLVLDTGRVAMAKAPYNQWRNCAFWDELPMP